MLLLDSSRLFSQQSFFTCPYCKNPVLRAGCQLARKHHPTSTMAALEITHYLWWCSQRHTTQSYLWGKSLGTVKLKTAAAISQNNLTELFVIKHERSASSHGATLQTILEGTAELASTSGRFEPESSSRLLSEGRSTDILIQSTGFSPLLLSLRAENPTKAAFSQKTRGYPPNETQRGAATADLPLAHCCGICFAKLVWLALQVTQLLWIPSRSNPWLWTAAAVEEPPHYSVHHQSLNYIAFCQKQNKSPQRISNQL